MSWLDDLEDKWRSAPDKWGHATGRLYVAGQDGEPIRGVMQVGMWPTLGTIYREAIADWICAMQNAMPRLLRIARLAEGWAHIASNGGGVTDATFDAECKIILRLMDELRDADGAPK